MNAQKPLNASPYDPASAPRLIAWELTSACNLKCVHCRASAPGEAPPGELSLAECRAAIDDIAAMEPAPILILTGGEPMVRPDFFDILEYCRSKGLRAVLATNGTTVTAERARRLFDLGIRAASVSLDGADAASHDSFRGQPGAFEGALAGIKLLQAAGIGVQINTTISRRNFREVERIYDFAVSLGAAAIHIFLLVPTGRAQNMKGDEISADDYERVLNWFYDKKRSDGGRVNLKATCAPHYYRIMRERAAAEGLKVDRVTFGADAATRGCLAGCGFAFISAAGIVQGCGYLPLAAGDVRKEPFSRIYRGSELFVKLRDLSNLSGKCAACEYRAVCGGCRARALAEHGDCFAEEPMCGHVPAGVSL